MREVVMCFDRRATWSACFLEADCVTSVCEPFFHFRTLEELRAVLDRSAAAPEVYEDFDLCVRQWSRGMVHLQLTDVQYLALKTKGPRPKP